MKNFNLSIWVSDHIGKPYECKYPHKFTATNEESLKKYVAKDHVFICFKNTVRRRIFSMPTAWSLIATTISPRMKRTG